MVARQVDAARGDLEIAMDKVHQAVAEVAWEVRSEIRRTVFL